MNTKTTFLNGVCVLTYGKERRGSYRVRPARAGLAVLAVAGLITGCGGGGGHQQDSNPPPVVPPPSTSLSSKAAVVISSDANDQFSELNAELVGIMLVDLGGNTVNLLPEAQNVEFAHVNGGAAPLAAVTIPPGLYKSAQVVLAGTTFTCVGVDPQGALITPTQAWSQDPVAILGVEVPQPIMVSGGDLVVNLKLLVSQSVFNSGNCGASVTSAVAPVFMLTAAPLATDPTGADNGAVTGLTGQVTQLSVSDVSDSFQLMPPSPSAAQLASLPTPQGILSSLPQAQASPLTVITDGTTQWQGISDISALTAGMFVDIDGAVQNDGSVRATRIAVEDPNAQNVRQGPLLMVSTAQPAVVELLPVQGQGTDETQLTESFALGSSTVFQVSGGLSNLGTLPFTPVFSAATLVPGQNVSIATPAFDTSGTSGYSAVADSATLLPQIVNGTIVSISTSGGFTVYQISLPAYEPLSILATQSGQSSLLTTPSTMSVYVGSSTLMLNSAAPAVGGTLRFYGLVFNDGGTLRMDCSRMEDGVTTPDGT